MAEAIPQTPTKRYAVVTGTNKGIGLEICKQLASKGVTVVLTARDEKRGIEALEKLKGEFDGISDYLLFHQLDVEDLSSIHSLADFIKTQFGKLDILVNNAGVGGGAIVDAEAFKAAIVGSAGGAAREQIKWNEITTETYEIAVKCLQTNYYGAKRMIEVHLPLLHLSDSPRIVNVSSSAGKLKRCTYEFKIRITGKKGRDGVPWIKLKDIITVQFVKGFNSPLFVRSVDTTRTPFEANCLQISNPNILSLYLSALLHNGGKIGGITIN